MYLNTRLWQGWLLLGDASLAHPKHFPRQLAVFSQTSTHSVPKGRQIVPTQGSGQALHTPAITVIKAPWTLFFCCRVARWKAATGTSLRPLELHGDSHAPTWQMQQVHGSLIQLGSLWHLWKKLLWRYFTGTGWDVGCCEMGTAWKS